MSGPLLFGWLALSGVLAALWWRQLRTQDASSVDVAWSLGLAALTVVHMLTAEAPLASRLLVGVPALVWALRLGSFLLTDRVLRATREDGRYRALREHWGAAAPRNFFVVYQAQAVVAALFSVPILAAMTSVRPDAFAVAGLLLWATAVAGETVSDRQLARFRADPSNRGQVCSVGLWRYSRHPNYFFEWMHWWAYVVLGRGAPLTWIGPALMLVLLFRVSGIPYTEIQALKSRGDAYRRYQRTTSVFIPWFPRKATS